ncbi:unnamed protein product [Amoebophrya sp. A25]|nr:unnamed protein product [Amoebophrya sp. A25]|eukprot:GSA25T00015183001.1
MHWEASAELRRISTSHDLYFISLQQIFFFMCYVNVYLRDIK